jgi:hypothetical protein
MDEALLHGFHLSMNDAFDYIGGHGQNAGHRCAQKGMTVFGGRWQPVILACPLRRLYVPAMKRL